MEDEIDLRLYVRGVLKHWIPILVLVALGAVGGAVYAASQAATVYRATALLSVAPSPYTLRLDGVAQAATLPARTYPDLARSDSVVEKLAARLQADSAAAAVEPNRLAGKLETELGADITLMRLIVTDADPAQAVRIANTWAEVVAETIGQLFGPDAQQVQAYERQLEDALRALDQAELNLAAYESESPVSILRAQLGSQQAALTGALDEHIRYQLLLQSGQDLLTRLGQQGRQSPADAADEAALLLLVAQIVSPASGTLPTASIQLQIGGAASGRMVGELASAVEALNDSMAARHAAAQIEAEALEPTLLALQGQLADARVLESELTRNRDLAEAQYLSLSAKVNDVKVAAQDAAGTVRIASLAANARASGGPSSVTMAAAGALLGLVAAIVAALTWEWWRGPQPALPAQSESRQEGARA